MNTSYKIGMVDPEISNIQQFLIKLGYSCKADGNFGPNTDAAVKKYQEDHELTVDGIIGPKTYAHILESIKSSIKLITEQDFINAAKELDCDINAVKAVQKVETGGRSGFNDNGTPKILFEGHIFWSQLQKVGINPMNYEIKYSSVLYKHWTKNKYFGGEKEYLRLTKAKNISIIAANKSASWGMFQIMGMNYAACGEPTIDGFINKMYESEGAQLELFVNFIKHNRKMWDALKNQNWAIFASYYNGPGYKENQYDAKLKAAYESYKRG